jgi:Cytochrome c oxidase subunit III.
VPLLNSLLLLSSGVSLTISHNLISLDLKSFNFYLGLTILLGLLFSYCQY